MNLTTWQDRAVNLLDGFGVTPVVECTGGNNWAVTVEHEDHVLVITDNGAGVYTLTGWNEGDEALWWREDMNTFRAVCFGMGQFAAISGWQKTPCVHAVHPTDGLPLCATEDLSPVTTTDLDAVTCDICREAL